MALTRAESVRDAGRRLWRRGGRRVQRAAASRRGLVAYLAVIGPGMIAANAGNDAGGIATYASAGADYGYNLLWTLIPLVLALGIVQETCARMGAVTGKGLSDLIREQFGVRWTVVVMLALLVANGGVTVSEFVGIAAATELFGVPRFVSVPLAAFAVWWLVVKGSYRSSRARLPPDVARLPQLRRLGLPRATRLGRGGARVRPPAKRTSTRATSSPSSRSSARPSRPTCRSSYSRLWSRRACARRTTPLTRADVWSGHGLRHRRRLLHHGGDRRDAPPRGRPHRVGGGRGARAASAGGRVRAHALRRRTLRRVDAGGGRAAALDRLLDQRGARVREGRLALVSARPPSSSASSLF